MNTRVIYGDVELYNVLTDMWDQETVYDASRTDLIGHKTTFRFRGVLHSQRVPIQDSATYIAKSSGSLSNVFDRLTEVRKALEEPRLQFEVWMDNVNVLTVTPARSGVQAETSDINNGPKPTHVHVTPIGGNVFRVAFEIEVMVGTCDKPRDTKQLVLNNRWSIAERMDANCYITRTITGTMRLSRTFDPGIGVETAGHAFKNIVVPPLEASFRRDSIDFSVAADGLTANYTVVDIQVHDAAPWPATKMHAQYSESVQYSTFFTSHMEVRLEGDQACDKRLLVERAIQILNARLELMSLENGVLLESFIISESIGEVASVTAAASVKRASDNPLNTFQSAVVEKMGAPLELPSLATGRGEGGGVGGTEYDPLRSRIPAIYGYRADSDALDWARNPLPTLLLHCYLQSPCVDFHGFGLASQGTTIPTEDRRRYEGTKVTESGYTPTRDSGSTYSQETAQSIYTFAYVSSTHCANHMRVQMPIANTAANGQSSEILTLARPQCYRKIEVELERADAEPAIPKALNTYMYRGVKAYLQYFGVEKLAPIRSPNGQQRIERTKARYLYLLDRSFNENAPLPVGINPVTKFPGYDGTSQLDLTGSMGISASGGSFTNS